MPSSSSLPALTSADISLSGALQRSLSLNFAPMAALSASSAPVTQPSLDIATNNESQSTEVEQDPESQIPRAVSPVPTEIIEDPPVEDILATVKAHGIKIRDFACPPETHKAVTEIFDPYRGIAEFEYYVAAKRVRRPIPGKTLRRLLNLGWVTEKEVEERCAQMDVDALEEYDAKVALDIKEGRGIYPWRALRWSRAPTQKERHAHVLKHMWHFVTVDRARKHLEELDREEKHRQKQAEEDERLAREFLERRRREEEERRAAGGGGALPPPQDWVSSRALSAYLEGTSRKRSLSNSAKENGNAVRDIQEDEQQRDDVDAYDGDERDLGEDAHGSSKRIRLSPRAGTPVTPPRRYGSPYLSPYASPYLSVPQSQSQSQDAYLHFSPPEKQYPAPLSSYDPKIYPEAASIISSQSQKQSQPGMGNDVSTPPGSPRQDTPPPPEEMLPQRGMKGKLGRTQTFSLL
jgi:hypothetical protein